MHSERETEEIIRRNGKKLKKICTDETSEQLVDERFQNIPIYLLQQEFDVNPFKKKSNFNPKGGAAIEMYLSRWEGKILFLDEKYLILIRQRGKKVSYICCMMIPPFLQKKLTKDPPWQYGIERIV